MRDKLIEILYNGFYVSPKDDLNGVVQKAADYLIAHGVTVQADVPDNNVGNKLEITVALKTTKIIASHLRKDFPFSANIIAAQIVYDLMAQDLLEVA